MNWEWEYEQTTLHGIIPEDWICANIASTSFLISLYAEKHWLTSCHYVSTFIDWFHLLYLEQRLCGVSTCATHLTHDNAEYLHEYIYTSVFQSNLQPRRDNVLVQIKSAHSNRHKMTAFLWGKNEEISRLELEGGRWGCPVAVIIAWPYVERFL